MRVRVEVATYTYTQNAKGQSTGRPRQARAYALVTEAGQPLFVGLFASEAKAAEWCKARGWKLVKEEAA